MNLRKAAPYFLLAFLMVVAFTEAMHYYPILPERLAIHWNASGAPNNWTTKSTFLSLMLIPFFFFDILFGGLALWFRVLPDAAFNLNHKDYWLAPLRRSQTIDYLSQQMLVFGCAVMAFFVGIYHLTYLANLSETQHLPNGPFFVLFLGFLAFTGFWVGSLVRRFNNVPG